MFDFIELEDLFVLIHIIGVAIGAGGAFISDALSYRAMRDRIISSEEIGFLTLAGRFVFLGLLVLFLSGIGIVLTSDNTYLTSPKFLAKMTIVGIIAINGFILHKAHLPWLKSAKNKSLHTFKEFPRKQKTMLLSGAISLSSWVYVIVLGSLHDIPYSYQTILTIYGFIITGAIFTAIALKDIFIPSRNK